ncbi:clp protease adapter protein ClpF, chloroplastic isoform X2 [Diospyros lotus]|uniref:clp protease adapter protein ClpF, chloroplastic isoform X2 n=1 Tax=Diospyros lotus TaxID=55363 RepID=UPI00224CFA8C|nr:clp protease adapter protein ClpF, chloroplastic isoform X2 [Diospyros lotus]
MLQVMSASTLTTSGSNCICGYTHLLRRHFRLMKGSCFTFGVDRSCLWYQRARSLPFIGHSDMLREQSWKVEAGWLFKGDDQGLNASSEQSESANEDILIFFFQLDLSTQVQRALNLEEYEIAQQLRNKLTEVETEVIRQQEERRGSASKSEAQDIAINMLRLRADLQSAIQSENYPLAAELRDKISKLEAESLAASAKAQLYEHAQYAFRLGQRVKHKLFGYQGIICGMDPVCCESSSWKEIAQVDKLSRGPDQPFYQLLKKICCPLINQTWPGLIIPTFRFYSMAWMQLEISSRSSSFATSTTGLGMRCPMIHQKTTGKMPKSVSLISASAKCVHI